MYRKDVCAARLDSLKVKISELVCSGAPYLPARVRNHYNGISNAGSGTAFNFAADRNLSGGQAKRENADNIICGPADDELICDRIMRFALWRDRQSVKPSPIYDKKNRILVIFRPGRERIITGLY